MEKLSYMLVRPPRFSYNPEIMVPSKNLEEKFTMEVHNLSFELTLFRPRNMKYVILYLHGNGSSRFEGYLSLFSLPDNVGLACFDFNGCGNRDGNFITLGKQESLEVDEAAKYLKKMGYTVVGWGRSMGSVSLALSNECDVMVLDSPYSNLS